MFQSFEHSGSIFYKLKTLIEDNKLFIEVITETNRCKRRFRNVFDEEKLYLELKIKSIKITDIFETLFIKTKFEIDPMNGEIRLLIPRNEKNESIILKMNA